jgi:PIN domain nuclease of toxin-antitoxin system
VNLLLDTHAFLWLMLDSERLSEAATNAIRDPAHRVALSAASAWEIAIKQSIGKLRLPDDAMVWVPIAAHAGGLDLVDVTVAQALATSALPWHHRDPFDRLLVAQASTGFTLVTHDRVFAAYGVPVLWT